MIFNVLGSILIVIVGACITVLNNIIYFYDAMTLQIRCYKAYKKVTEDTDVSLEDFLYSLHKEIYKTSSSRVQIGRYTRSLIQREIRDRYNVDIRLNKISEIVYSASNSLNLEIVLREEGIQI